LPFEILVLVLFNIPKVIKKFEMNKIIANEEELNMTPYYAHVDGNTLNIYTEGPNPNPIGGYRDLTSQFDIICPQIWRGYMTNVSPWFSLYTNDVPGLVLRLDSCPNNNTMRFGSVHIQFAA
jgi:hypothetical protein